MHSWNALAGPKQEPIKENSAASASVPGGKHKAEKKESKQTAPEIGKVVYLSFDDGPNLKN